MNLHSVHAYKNRIVSLNSSTTIMSCLVLVSKNMQDACLARLCGEICVVQNASKCDASFPTLLRSFLFSFLFSHKIWHVQFEWNMLSHS